MKLQGEIYSEVQGCYKPRSVQEQGISLSSNFLVCVTGH